MLRFPVPRSWPRLLLQMLIACVALTCVLPRDASAAGDNGGYPNRPVTIVVPFPPGGSPDQLARILAQQLGVLWNQPVVVENRPGAGGNIAAGVVVRAKPDGYTLLMGTDGPLAINPSIYAHMPYDPRRDFAPIGLAAHVDFVLVADPALPVRNVAELLKLAHNRQPAMTYASSGVGSQHHLGMELFQSDAGVELRHVPYKGVSPALADVMGGHVSVMFAAMPAAAALVRSGKVRAIAVTGPNRSPMLAEIPTIGESGIAGLKAFELRAWFGLVAPARTPAPLVARLNGDLNRVLGMTEVQATLARNGFRVEQGSSGSFASFIESERLRWARVAQSSGVHAE
ncbi:Bug family tripartite tricarboxylate transporter substrate binding protein [Cupriavidus necator]|uniref:Bug family tripartite tricarboxylate transporter substrate binding protein n=1 Tax=Cupriavidus necator TaxID=106590 RepID=UPI00068E042D|nr:tripartite tricarboxylate transporter substrate binding protein [Cupriavidus necator]